MVEVDVKIVIAGMICLTLIYLTMISCGRDTETMGFFIVGIIALAIGVVIPTPKIDNKSGVLRW